MDAVRFEAADFGDLQASLVNTNVDEGLDFETVTVDVHDRNAVLPEGVVAVAKVRELAAVKDVGEGVEAPVANPANRGDVGRAATTSKTSAFGEVGAVDEGLDICGDLTGVSRAISVKHDDDVAGSGLEAVLEGVALATTGLVDDTDIRAQSLRYLDGVVGGVPIDDENFVDVLLSKELEDVRQVLGLVEGRNNDRNLWGLYDAEVRTGRDVWLAASQVDDDVVADAVLELHEFCVCCAEFRLSIIL